MATPEDNANIEALLSNLQREWEFWGRELIDESEIVVVSWKEIIEIDPTLLEIANLSPGFNAVRKELSSPWEIISKS